MCRLKSYDGGCLFIVAAPILWNRVTVKIIIVPPFQELKIILKSELKGQQCN